MKSLMKISARYVATAAGIALILLVLNLTAGFAWLVQSKSTSTTLYNYHELADSLTRQNGAFVMSDSGKALIHRQYQWAMLLNDGGEVVWSESLPEDVPLRYTVSDVASFSRWYLGDYPVHVWDHPDGLLVLGGAKGSSWKHDMEMPEQIMANLPAWLGGVIILNGIAAVLLALLFGLRLFRSLRPLIRGIEQMAEKQPVALSTGGLLGDLAEKLNRTSEQLTRQETALQKRDTARAAWIAGISHDIRTPLSMVMGYASQLENDARLPAAEQNQAGIIRRQSEKIKALVNDLNLTSKLEYDMQPLRKASIHPAVMVRSIVTDILNNGLDEDYSITLNVADDAQKISIIGDEYLLRRAVSNLIENSIRHNPDGCDIVVAVDTNVFDCSITVSDNGVGFSPETLEALKKPGIPAEARKHGLGLTIVQQIVKSHGGAVAFKHLSGSVCQTVIQLPLAAPEELKI